MNGQNPYRGPDGRRNRRRRRPWLLLVLLIGGCRSTPSSEDLAPAGPLVWPAPPASPRIAYVESIAGPADLGLRHSRWKTLIRFITGSDRGRESFVRPQGVAVDEHGNICLTDPGAGAVWFFDRLQKRYHRWEAIGTNRWFSPVAAACRNGVFYVADSGLGKVLAFDERGQASFEIGDPLRRPVGLALAKDRLLVADAQLNRVFQFDLQGRLVGQFGSRGAGPGAFNAPTHLAVDASDFIYVTDSLNFRVAVFDAAGHPVRTIGSAGDSSGHFSRPKGVAVDSRGHLYVVDALFDNVQVFDDQGRFLLNWGESGSAPGEFWLPAGIAVDAGGQIFVADAYNRRLQVFKYVGEE